MTPKRPGGGRDGARPHAAALAPAGPFFAPWLPGGAVRRSCLLSLPPPPAARQVRASRPPVHPRCPPGQTPPCSERVFVESIELFSFSPPVPSIQFFDRCIVVFVSFVFSVVPACRACRENRSAPRCLPYKFLITFFSRRSLAAPLPIDPSTIALVHHRSGIPSL